MKWVLQIRSCWVGANFNLGTYKLRINRGCCRYDLHFHQSSSSCEINIVCFIDDVFISSIIKQKYGFIDVCYMFFYQRKNTPSILPRQKGKHQDEGVNRIQDFLIYYLDCLSFYSFNLPPKFFIFGQTALLTQALSLHLISPESYPLFLSILSFFRHPFYPNFSPACPALDSLQRNPYEHA